MSLPDATSILKRAREEEEDPPVTIDDVYRDVVSVISKEHPVDLCDGEGIYIGVSNVPRLKHITPFGRQYLFRKVAKQRGYVATSDPSPPHNNRGIAAVCKIGCV